MHLPFTAGQFFEVFRRYNEGIWPAQLALLAIALVAAFAAYRADLRNSWRWGRVAFVLLAVLWFWTGIVYHKIFFARLTPAAQIFGSMFIAQGALLLLTAAQDGSSFTRASRGSALAGALLIAYALLLYPSIGFVLGQHYPSIPTFGAPCPVTIFTFGVYCLLPASVPRFALPIPVLWAVIASSAALSFGVWEDLALVPAAAVAIALVHRVVARWTAKHA